MSTWTSTLRKRPPRAWSTLLTALLLAALVARPLAAGEVDLAAAVAGARVQADQALAAERARIAKERAALMKRVQEAHAAAERARERALNAARERDQRAAELKTRKQEQHEELAKVRALVDRAVVGAKVPEAAARAVEKAPSRERLALALRTLDERVGALPVALSARLGDERIIGRDGVLASAPVLRLGRARALALGDTAPLRGVLVLAGDGATWRVGGPALPPAVAAAGGGALPALIALDPDGTAVTQPPPVERTLAQWIAGGRAWIWPIIIAFALGILTVLWRALALLGSRVDPRRLVAVAELLHRGDRAGALALTAGRATPLDRVLDAGVAALPRSREAREATVEQALIAEQPALHRGLGLIVVMASVAPLLGLLGTVTGMIDMFAVIAQQGSGNARSLSGGISEALICTQAGMMCAIPLLLAHAALARVADRRLLLLEEAACGVLGLADHVAAAPALDGQGASDGQRAAPAAVPR